MGLNIFFFRHWNLGNTCVPMLDNNITFNSPFDSFPFVMSKVGECFHLFATNPKLAIKKSSPNPSKHHLAFPINVFIL
jgi:hypothetical protein